jgi:glucose-6-phosphate 1-dehydrogenase
MPSPLTLIVFGSTGDLYQNKLSSALFNLFSLGLLPEDFSIVGFARRPLSDAEFQSFTLESILKKGNLQNPGKLVSFLKHIKYFQGDLESMEDFKKLGEKLALDDEQKVVCTDKIFYLAVPPFLYAPIFKNISEAGLTIPCVHTEEGRAKSWTRILVEKPFGKDIKDAKKLDLMLGKLFDESQIFRIDHYLAKETMQNLLTFRFSNGVFDTLLSNENVERVRIVFYEADVPEDTLKNRGAFYDGVGALRDVGQNHMLQMLALIAMENPKEITTGKIQDARSLVLQKTSLFNKNKKDTLFRGQYKGYQNESGVKSDSKTETFFRIILGVNNKKWVGVPFEMESGKALDREEKSIEIFFKKPTPCICRETHIGGHRNVLKFIIQPDEGIKFRFWFKRPGFDFDLVPQDLSFDYSENYFADKPKGKLHDAYERIFYDCILGDQTLFTNTKEIMAEWKIITGIIKAWQSVPLVVYKKGSTGEEIKI